MSNQPPPMNDPEGYWKWAQACYASTDRERMADLLGAECVRAYRVARRAGLLHEDAEEIAQEYCIGLLKAKAAYDPSRPAKAYVNAILSRAISSRRRSLWRDSVGLAACGASPKPTEPDYVEPAATDATPLEALLRSELRDRSWQLIELLPPAYREVVALDLEGLTDEQIAETLGLTLTNAQQRLYRARQRLRSLLLPVLSREDLLG